MTVSNVAPVVDVGADAAIDEGDTFVQSGSFSDPGSDSWTATVDYGEGDGAEPLALTGKAFDLSNLYEQDGIYMVTVCVSDDDTEACDTATVTVSNVPPAVSVSLASQRVQYSDYICEATFTATDVAADTLAASTLLPLPASLALTSNGCTYSDDGVWQTCTWTLSGTVDQPEGGYDITVTIDDGDGSGSVNTVVNVDTEDATVTFDKDNPVGVQVDAPDGDSPPFSLIVYVKETEIEEEGDCGTAEGDIGLAEVSMNLVPVGPGGGATVACTQDEMTEFGLRFECEFDNVLVNTYTAETTVGGDYYVGHGEDVVVVYDPSLGFTTGGGWFYWPDSDDPDTGYAGDKTNFGYTMKYNKKGGNVKGSLLLIRHLADGSIYRIKSNALYGLALGDLGDYGWATFSGKSTYLEPGWPEPIGNYMFIVYVEDWNEPGTGVDRFWIQTRDKDRVVIPSMSMAEPATEPLNSQMLQGGNVVVPHGVPDKLPRTAR